MLLNILQCIGQPPKQSSKPKCQQRTEVDLEESADPDLEERQNMLSRNTVDVKKTQTELLEMKTMTLDRINRIDTVEKSGVSLKIW